MSCLESKLDDLTSSDFYLTDGVDRTHLHKERLSSNEYFKVLFTTKIGGDKTHLEVAKSQYSIARWYLRRFYFVDPGEIPNDIDVIAALTLGREWLISDDLLNLVFSKYDLDGEYSLDTVDDLNYATRLIDKPDEVTMSSIRKYYEKHRDVLPVTCFEWESIHFIDELSLFYLACKYRNAQPIQDRKVDVDIIRDVIERADIPIENLFTMEQIGILGRASAWHDQALWNMHCVYVKSLVPFCVTIVEQIIGRHGYLRGRAGQSVFDMFQPSVSFTNEDQLVIIGEIYTITSIKWIRGSTYIPVTKVCAGLDYEITINRDIKWRSHIGPDGPIGVLRTIQN